MENVIAARIYSHRIKMSLSQDELAQLIGVRQPTVSHYESGKRQPSISLLMLLAQALQVKTSELLGEQ